MSLVSELKRRNVVRMAGLYLVGAWLVVQVASTLLPIIGAPGWVVRALVLMLALFFVPALVFSWVYELTPSGLKREADLEPRPAQATATGRRMERMILGLLALAVLYFGFDRFVLARARPGGRTGETVAAGAPAGAPAASPKSIAVLAFTDLSPRHDQDYFSDGMAEEILNALAQVRDLKVAGRTSSFYYKGRNENLSTVGRALGVANILEGSVRKQGGRVRITARLIRAADDTHLWSHEYDGDLSDVFKLQEQIARAITDQLQVVLEGGQKTQLVQIGTTNPEAYALYLQATSALNQRDYHRMGQAIGWLERAIQLDPRFARAHSRLAMIHVLGDARYGSKPAEVERHARAAMALDSTLAEAQIARGLLLARFQHRYLDARAAMDRAVALAPEDADVLLYDAQLLITTGYTRAGTAQLDRTLAIDPMLPNALNWRAQQYILVGDLTAAERMLSLAQSLGLSFAPASLATLAAARRDYVRARTLVLPSLMQHAACFQAPAATLPIYVEGVYGGDASARAKSLAIIGECLAAHPTPIPSWVPIGLMAMGQPDRALEVLGRAPVDDSPTFIRLWSPLGQEARRSRAFAGFARRVGLAEVWDRYGAPDLCHKDARGDYVCE